MKQYAGSLSRRLWRKIEFKPGNCWLWQGVVGNHGYGTITADRKRYLVHRVAYTISRGPIPAGMTVDHLCRTRTCANPYHMELVTAAENLHRGAILPHRCRKGHI